MTTLRKTENAEDIFTVIVESSVDMTTFAKSYEVINPETDMLTQILVYAKENNWYINQWDTRNELLKQIELNLTEEELLEKVSNVDKLNDNINELAYEINSYASHGIEYLTITKFGDKYELDVTKDDIRKIFLNMIQ